MSDPEPQPDESPAESPAESSDEPGAEASLSPEPLSPEEVAEARRYSQATLRCTVIDIVLDLMVLTAMALVVGPWIDHWLGGYAALADERSYLRLAFLAAAIVALHSMVSAPLSYYSGFVIEHRFGLSTQSRSAWWVTWLKKAGLTLAMLMTLYVGLFAIIWNAGSWWWLASAAAFFVVSAVLGQLAPVLILPLFYKVEPLESDEEAERLRRLADGTGLTIEGVFRLGMSAETSKANAMLAGAGSTRRVLMGDTLLDEFTPGEVDIVFAHELGHHVHRHLPKLMVLAGLTAIGGFWLCNLALSGWTGVADPSQWATADLPKVTLVLTLFSLIIGPLQGLVSRHFERQADTYAVQRTNDQSAFRSAFIKLARMNKADLDPHPAEVFLLHSHPPIRERLALAERVSRELAAG